jgi:hypothetical protein
MSQKTFTNLKKDLYFVLYTNILYSESHFRKIIKFHLGFMLSRASNELVWTKINLSQQLSPNIKHHK